MSFVPISSTHATPIPSPVACTVTFIDQAHDASTVYYAADEDDLKDGGTGDGSLSGGQSVSITGTTFFQAAALTTGDASALLSVEPAQQSSLVVADALSLRRDFNLNPSMPASFLGTKINDAIQSAISAGRPLSIGWEAWKVDVPLLIDGPFRMLGTGVRERWGDTTATNGTLFPFNVPLETDDGIDGACIVQTSSGTDAIQITVVGEPVDLIDLGVRFDGSHRWSDTGHGINSNPGLGSDSHTKVGMMGNQWRGLKVYGHDGDHYGYEVWNNMYPRHDNLRSYGGGGLHFVHDSITTFFGNLVSTDSVYVLFLNGSAHAMYIDAKSTGAFKMDFCTWFHPQCWVTDASKGSGPTTFTAPTSAQKCVEYNSAGAYHHIQAFGLDMETNVGSKMNWPTGMGNYYNSEGSSATAETHTLEHSPVSGTTYTNNTGTNSIYMLEFELNPTADADATVDALVKTFFAGSLKVPAGGPTGMRQMLVYYVPSGMTYTTTWANATLVSATDFRTISYWFTSP